MKSLSGQDIKEKSWKIPIAVPYLLLWNTRLKTICTIHTAESSEVFCCTPQLCHGKEETNKTNKSNSNKQPYVPFVEINIKTFCEGFKPTDLLSDNEEKSLLSRTCVKKVMKLMIKSK